VNSTKKKKQSSIKLALCMTSFVHCNIRRFSTLQNLVLSFSYCPLIHLEKLPNEPLVSLSPSVAFIASSGGLVSLLPLAKLNQPVSQGPRRAPSQHIHITMRSVAATGVYVLRPSTLP